MKAQTKAKYHSFAESTLRQSYLAHRNDDCIYPSPLPKVNRDLPIWQYVDNYEKTFSDDDMDWFQLNVGEYYYYHVNELTEGKITDYQRNCEYAVIKPKMVNLKNSQLLMDLPSCKQLKDRKVAVPKLLVSPKLEEKLANFLINSPSFSDDRLKTIASIFKYTKESRNLEIISAAHPKSPYVVENVEIFSQFWIRSPLTWEEDSGISLLEHLFSLYSAPVFLRKEWFQKPSIQQLKWLVLYILYSQGGSLHIASKLLGWKVSSKKFWHNLAGSPAYLRPLKAIIYTELQGLRGSQKLFSHILKNPSYCVDLTELSNEHYTFWCDTIRWLILHEDQLTGTECERVLSWARHKYTETINDLNVQTFSIKGRNVRETVRRINVYFQQINRTPYGIRFDRVSADNTIGKWRAKGFSWCLVDSGSHWVFTELISSDELYAEGNALNHCVYLYSSDCIQGDTRIISLALNGKRCATIEVALSNKLIVQIKGSCNREATDEENSIISIWKDAVLNQ